MRYQSDRNFHSELLIKMKNHILAILILLAAAVVSVKADLVGWWRFDNASNPGLDSSSYTNDGTLVGDCALSSDAISGTGALQFSGGYIQLYSCADGGFYGDFSSGTATFALWIKLDVSSPLAPNIGLANIGAWCYPSLYPSAINTISLKLFLSSGNAINIFVPSGTDLIFWHHLAVTVDSSDTGSGYKVYFDGRLLGAFPMNGTYGNFLGPDKPRLGAAFDASTNSWYYLYGKIDDVRLYNQVLTAAQIQNLVYNPDLTNDKIVNYSDLSSLTVNWLSGCSGPDWCNGADINHDSVVNFVDFTYLAQQWLQASP
jgi:hypothetical protein